MKKYIFLSFLIMNSIFAISQQEYDFVKKYNQLKEDSHFVGTESEIVYCDTSYISMFIELKKEMDACRYYDEPYPKVLFLVGYGFNNYKQFLVKKQISDSINGVRDSLKAVYLKKDYGVEFNRLKTDSQLMLDDKTPPSILFFDTAYYGSFKDLLDAMDLIERYDEVYSELSTLFYRLKSYKSQLDLLAVYNTNADNYRKRVEEERKEREKIQKQKDLEWKKKIEEKNARFSNKISIGESKSSVINKWGMPDRSSKLTYEFGVIETFEYDWISTWVTFSNGYVQQIYEF